jgi:hypothetical protein
MAEGDGGSMDLESVGRISQVFVSSCGNEASFGNEAVPRGIYVEEESWQ